MYILFNKKKLSSIYIEGYLIMNINFGLNKQNSFCVNDDIFCKLTEKSRRYQIINNTVCLLVGKKKLPVWRVVRNVLHPEFDVVYKDGDFKNLLRENLLLVRKKK